MLLVFTTCAAILAPSPGCRVHRVPIVVDVIPTGCAAKVQAVVAERAELQGSGRVVRYACERRHRQGANAEAGR
jgi:hypothetical protein